MNSGVSGIPEGYHSVTPYLIVSDGVAALAWYAKVFGARELFRFPSDDGRVGHAEMLVGTSRIMLADDFPELGVRSPRHLGGSPVWLLLYLANVDETLATALAAGATLLKPLEDKFYGDRSATVVDPFGHQWTLATHLEDVAPEEMALREKAARESTSIRPS